MIPPAIKSITVLEGGRGMDTVFIKYDAADPVWPFTGALEAKFTVAKGDGAEYVKTVFGIEPVIINIEG